jgi:hypothetical protein
MWNIIKTFPGKEKSLVKYNNLALETLQKQRYLQNTVSEKVKLEKKENSKKVFN